MTDALLRTHGVAAPHGSFCADLVLRYLDGKNWELTRDFAYHVGRLGSRAAVVVPAATVTDFASIPQPLRWWWPPAHADYGKAAVIHDYLYRGGVVTLGYPVGDDDATYRPHRLACDDIFNEAMAVLGCPGWKRELIYHGVRVGGFRAYQDDERRAG